MRIQKSYIDSIATLYLVPTPIGNFDDMTFRSVEILKSVDLIYCEDTRVTKVLLSHFQITTPLRSYHIFNEDVKVNEIIEELKENKSIALVSDAGLPCISDPGYLISSKAIKEGFNVVSIPGASAGITALVGSGIPNDKYLFYGFLNSKTNQRLKQLESLKDFPETIVFYEAPHRILFTLKDMLKVLGNRNIVIARELTKKYEEYTRGLLEDIINNISEFKGEIVIIVESLDTKKEVMDLNTLSLEEHYNHYLNQGLLEKDAMKRVANDLNISKSDVYKKVKVK